MHKMHIKPNQIKPDNAIHLTERVTKEIANSNDALAQRARDRENRELNDKQNHRLKKKSLNAVVACAFDTT